MVRCSHISTVATWAYGGTPKPLYITGLMVQYVACPSGFSCFPDANQNAQA